MSGKVVPTDSKSEFDDGVSPETNGSRVPDGKSIKEKYEEGEFASIGGSAAA